MPAHRAPRWTPREVAALRDSYRADGLEAAMKLLPGRSWHSIYVKAFKLGIRCEREPDAPRCRLQGDDLEEAIKLREADGWSFARIGAHFGIAESSACNAVMIALCTRKGFTPAERHANGRLTERGMERLRWCLKKGLKGVEIQLRLGLSASCIAEQRRRYNAELKANGKAALPPPGNGVAYSGARVSLATRREAERLFLEGFGTLKVSEQTGASKTVCTRIRGRLIRRLKKSGQSLPGCDVDGTRRVMRDHSRHVPDELRAKVRELILQRVPVRRAAAMCGVGTCTAYRIRDALKAELGDIPKPRLPGKTKPLQREMMQAQAIPPASMWRYRLLVRQLGDADQARAALRAELAEAKRNLTFEDQLELIAQGRLKIAAVQHFGPSDHARTLGGVTGEIL